jgi:hypothetical protein
MFQRVWLLGVLLLAIAGCHHPETRLQAEEEPDRNKEKEKEVDVRTIGDVSSYDNASPIAVSGVGLVVGLDGTGGGAPPGGYRSMLEDQLRKYQHLDNTKEILASPDAALVLVSAVIPAGARKNDLLDVEVSVPREGKVKSLRGGRLVLCVLYNYDTTRGLDPNYTKGDRPLQGHPLAFAEGSLIVGFGDGDEAARLRHGRIWGGGRCRIDRPFFIALNNDKQFASVAKAVADRINETFQMPGRGPEDEIAVAKTKAAVCLNVPAQYRLNLPRYLRVVRLIPLRETEASRIAYRRQLEEQLLDPAHTVTSALRLEALGQDSIPILKRGLTSEHVLVRFCAAEALAYLGSPSCGEELSRMVEHEPALRAFSLTAMASLDEAICHVELRRLLAAPSAEARYGAFRALHALDEHEEAVQGELLNDSFWLHRVAPQSPPLVHLTTSKRAEIVLFGEDACLAPPFAILAGEFTVTASKDDDCCTVCRISARHGRQRRQCPLKLENVLRTLAELGAVYPDVVDVLRRVDHLQCLSCKVAVDALPQDTTVYELAKAGAGEHDATPTNPEIVKARADFSATPTLFEREADHRPNPEGGDEEPHKKNAAAKNTTSSP